MTTEFPDPYLIPGTQVLRNVLGETDQARLMEMENDLSMARMMMFREHLPAAEGTVAQLQHIHWFLFQDVYAWAGELRTINIEKGGSLFFAVERFGMCIQYCEKTLQDDNLLVGLDRDAFVRRLAVNYDNFNVLHPFREGNGRAQRLFWDVVAAGAGWQLDWSMVTGRENDEASYEAMHTSGYGKLERLLDRIVKPLNGPLERGAFISCGDVLSNARMAEAYSPQEYAALERRYTLPSGENDT